MSGELPVAGSLSALPLGLFGSMTLGLSMGLTACTVTCLPFLGTWALGRGRGHDLAMRDTWLFLGGRVLAYGLLGLLAGWMGARLAGWLSGGIGHLAIGLASCLAGGVLIYQLLRSAQPRTADAATSARPLQFHRQRPSAGMSAGCRRPSSGARLPPFLLGLSLSLTPCAPLGWLLGICSLSGSALAGAGHGLAFGLGAAVTPLLLLVPLFGTLGARLLSGRAWLHRWLAGGAGAVLMVLGIRRLLLI